MSHTQLFHETVVFLMYEMDSNFSLLTHTCMSKHRRDLINIVLINIVVTHISERRARLHCAHSLNFVPNLAGLCG